MTVAGLQAAWAPHIAVQVQRQTAAAKVLQDAGLEAKWSVQAYNSTQDGKVRQALIDYRLATERLGRMGYSLQRQVTGTAMQQGVNQASALKLGQAAVTTFSLPPLPHPDASNLSLGPNLGGSDAVVDTPTTAGTGTGAGASGAGGLLLLGVVGVLVFAALRRK